MLNCRGPKQRLTIWGIDTRSISKRKNRTSEATGLSRLTRSLGKTHTVSARPHAVWAERTIDLKPDIFFMVLIKQFLRTGFPPYGHVPTPSLLEGRLG